MVGLIGHLLLQLGWRMFGSQQQGVQGTAMQMEQTDAHAMFRLGTVAWFQADTTMLLYTALRSLNLAQSEGSTTNLARQYAGMAVVVGAAQWRSLATHYTRLSYDVAARVDDPTALAQVDLFSAIYGVGMGDWSGAEVRIARAMEAFDRLGDNRKLDECRVTGGYAQLHAGHYARAEQLFDDCARSGRVRGDRQTAGWGLLGKARVRLVCADFEAVSPLLTEAEPLAGDRLSAIELHGQWALIHLNDGDLQRSASRASSGLDLIRQSRPLSFSTLIGTAAVAQALLVLWSRNRSAESEGLARSALMALRQFAGVFPIGLPFADLLRGQHACIEGKLARSKKLWERAAATASTLQMPCERALAVAALDSGSVGGSPSTRSVHAPIMMRRRPDDGIPL